MTVVLSNKQQALAYVMRHPPKETGLKPQKYKDICKHIKAPGKAKPKATTVHASNFD